jgi:hypothetical protein
MSFIGWLLPLYTCSHPPQRPWHRGGPNWRPLLTPAERAGLGSGLPSAMQASLLIVTVCTLAFPCSAIQVTRHGLNTGMLASPQILRTAQVFQVGCTGSCKSKEQHVHTMRASVKCSLAVRILASGAEMFERKMGSANGDGRARVCDTCSSTRDCTSRATLM